LLSNIEVKLLDNKGSAERERLSSIAQTAFVIGGPPGW
jgi:hypothetical protein